MNAKVKALAWEEFRVGGAIAATCLVVGLFTLVSYRLSYGWKSWGNYDPDFLYSILLGVPMLTALLLILNPNYSGHLAGGFSTRVLRLPVRVTIAVAAALIARTLFVFIVTLVLATAAQGLFGDIPQLRIAAFIVLFYVLAQALDWIRGPVSGLSSILLILCAAGIVYVLASGGSVFESVLAGFEMTPLRWALALAAVMTGAYFVSVSAVHASRVGRSTGIPEIWEWPRKVSLSGRGRQGSFSSPMAAQVWFETRRAGWTLPGATLLLLLIASGVLWLYMRHDGHSEEYRLILFRNYSSVFIFVSFFLATFIHGIRTRVVGFGWNTEVAGHEWMHPLTSAEFALARVLSNALVFLPTLLLVTLVHFALIGGYFLTSLVPEALAMGTASIREVVWVIFSRGVLLGIVAWTFVATGTRLLRASAAVAFLLLVTSVIVGFLDNVNFVTSGAQEATLWRAITLFLLYLVGLTGFVYVRLWKEGCIRLRSVATCGAVWAITSCFIFYVTLFNQGESPGETSPLEHVVISGLSYSVLDDAPAAWDILITSLAYGSLVILPYAAILLDIRRRRHGAARDQEATQHEGAMGRFSQTSRVAIGALATASLLFMLWMAWPTAPAYEAVLRSNGYPVTLDELDAWYKEVPEDENIALKYSALYNSRAFLPDAYFQSKLMLDGAIEQLLIVGKAQLSRAEPIPRKQWEITEEYWETVTAPVASRLKEIADEALPASRYPIDLRAGYMVDLPHLSKLRVLADELSLDALHWTLAGNTGEAAASIRAIFPIAKSLSEEPLLVSQSQRFTILSIAFDATKTTLNRSLPADADLARISEAIDLALPSPDGPMMLRRGIIGENLQGLSAIESFSVQDASIRGKTRAPLLTFNQVLTPSGASRIVLATRHERNIRASSEKSLLSDLPKESQDEDWNKLAFMVPHASRVAYAMSWISQSERRVRMQLEVTRTALAVERYRLAHGSLPENLESLVPAFLSLIPDDAFAEPKQSIRYWYTGDGKYVVYSIGRDKKDDGGEEDRRKGYESDITFTVAPLHVRTQAQIAP